MAREIRGKKVVGGVESIVSCDYFPRRLQYIFFLIMESRINNKGTCYQSRHFHTVYEKILEQLVSTQKLAGGDLVVSAQG